MVFSSLLFLYVFLALNLLCYALVKSLAVRNAVMLVFSLVFYAWGEPKYVLLLLFMTFADWVLALGIGRAHGTPRARLLLVLACVVNLGLLGVFKYGTFFLENTHALLGVPAVIPQIALPIGISFYTFQLLSYVVDVYRGEVAAQRRYHMLLLYASLFHQCIAGPIVRYQDVASELLLRRTNIGEIGRGITRFATGLGKKALFANVCGALSEQLLPAALEPAKIASTPALAIWGSMLAYMLQIYLDFSAYSDMAIGMGQMIGFHYKENFDYPYLSRTVSEFWRRWHISLGSFFRDYVYIPLGGNRRGKLRTYWNLFVVWFLTGFWHGASWNFMLWGLYFFVFIAIERLFWRRCLEKLPGIVSHVYLLLVVFFGWILFRFQDLSTVWLVFKGLFGLNGNGWSSFGVQTTLLNYVFLLAAAILACTPLVKRIGRAWRRQAEGSVVSARAYVVVQAVLPAALLLLSTLLLVGDSYNPFLYFQF